ncbi:hypothetical protein SAMN05661091_3473 [Paenibacillus uliginis N3/975]|uniref:5-bromo-4-chloroindolyl phosphate hydrolysis protein n=2 Tax=Paenibacillus TaxID=44249 RepID=A0A1X7HHW4_9BACL|nr:hypothetical protein SAMN05661091_3473 [Paenibacillus uliginis N3/975]
MLSSTNMIKLIGLMLIVAVVNILVLSPGFIGVRIGTSALSTATGVTLLFASAWVLVYGIYHLLFKKPVMIPVKEIKTYEEYVENLSQYRHVKGIESDISLALEQMERMQKRKSTLIHVLKQRFEETEMSFKKFASVSQEVENLFYLNIRNILNILLVFDESEFNKIINRKSSGFSTELLQKKANVYHDYLSSMKSSLSNNEEILLKLDRLLLEISSLDNIEPGDIEQLSCMQELDALIKQTKYYK